MAISILALRKNLELLNDLSPKAQGCAVCHAPLQEAITGKRRTANGDYCSDCYYEEAGALVEASPIVTARIRRG